MKIAGISRVRNEEYIIQNTLKHVSELVDEIYIFDDCSTDRTPDMCEAHPKVKRVFRGKTWATTPWGRQVAEGELRQIPYEEAVRNNADWVYCFDADEFADFDDIDFTIDAYRLRLFDFYIF
jgi:glycosyltransferase involved in cell wall biosynthesis